ncbi:MAG: tetratricopeptide repeat protein [Phycisphaerae bacterium]|nr:tetratricopeptide repeat protein [Phycisphaerae bacterium]
MVEQFYGNHGRSWRCARAIALCLALSASACDGTNAPTVPSPAKPAASARAVDAAIQSAESYLAAQRPREAVQVAARLAEEAPTLMRAHELHARSLVALAFDPETNQADRARWIGEAADAYDRATELEPTLAALHHAAGVLSNTAKRPEAALAHYRAAHNADPTNAQYALYLGVALASAGELEEARALIQDAERRAPTSPDPKAALADLAVRQKDFAAARTAIARARALDPASLGLRLADARIRRLDKHPDESLDMLLALDPPVRQQPGVAEELALAHTALGDFAAAAIVLENSARAVPQDWRRAVRTAHAWQRAGDPVKAQVWLQSALGAGAPPEALQESPQD